MTGRIQEEVWFEEMPVTTNGQVRELAKILMTSSDLVNRKEELFLALGLSRGDVADVKRDAYFDGSGTQGFFTKALEKWKEVAANHFVPTNTLKHLVLTLQKDGLNGVANDVQTRYSKLRS